MDNKNLPEMTPKAKALRKNMTPEENKLWYQFLRRYPVRFRRQKPLGIYVADFYCAKAKLAIELDGSQHYDFHTWQYDERRTSYLSQYDITVVRIPNNEINYNFRVVCEYIDYQVKLALGEITDQ